MPTVLGFSRKVLDQLGLDLEGLAEGGYCFRMLAHTTQQTTQVVVAPSPLLTIQAYAGKISGQLGKDGTHLLKIGARFFVLRDLGTEVA